MREKASAEPYVLIVLQDQELGDRVARELTALNLRIKLVRDARIALSAALMSLPNLILFIGAAESGEIDGAKLGMALRTIRPRLPVLLISVVRPFQQLSSPFGGLNQPVSGDELITEVMRLISESDGS